MLNDFSSQDADQVIADLQSQVNRSTQVLRQLQNVGGIGVGSTLPSRTKSGLAVPPVSRVSAVVTGTVRGGTTIAVTWLEPSGTNNIDRYNIYIKGLVSTQSQEVLVFSTKTSPAILTLNQNVACTITIFVQTVLTTGQVIPVGDCPSTAINLAAPMFAIGVRVYQSTNSVVLASSNLTVPWDLESYKTIAAMHDNVTDNTKLFSTSDGYYRINLMSSTIPATMSIVLLLNGSNATPSVGINVGSLNYTIYIGSGSYIQARIANSAGFDQNAGTMFMEMQYLGA